MKLNHINLTVTDIDQPRQFLKTYFGLRDMDGGNVNLVGLLDDDGMVITLMRAKQASDVSYPFSFHIGFLQPSEDAVNELNRRLHDDGFDVQPPRRMHGAWAFYVQAPGGVLIEVAC